MARAARLLVAVLVLTGCAGGGDPPELRTAADLRGGFGLGIPGVRPGTPWVVQQLIVCVEPSGSVELVEVRAVGSGLRVDDFALRENPMWPGADTFGTAPDTDRRGPLREAGFEPADKTATLVCEPGTGRGHELAIQLTNPGPRAGSAQAFEVDYRTGGEERTLLIPLEVRLCPRPARRCGLGG